jgi:hypothetical protein
MQQHQGTARRVTFSEVSKLYAYHEDRPQKEELFYNKMDYDAFRIQSASTARKIIDQVEAKLDDQSFTLHEPESWLPSPQILQQEDASIEPEEIIGLEHVTMSRRATLLLDALTRNHKMGILNFHPEQFEAMISNVSTVMAYIALCKAKNAADHLSY